MAILPPQNLAADLILLHAPSVFDFREKDDVLFAYLSDSDSVNVTSIYEMYPLGFRVMQQHLKSQGFKVEIVNLASLMLMYPELDVDKLLSHLEAPIFGLDLHWMAQCHGAIEIAEHIHRIHPDALIIMGGISATYFARELIAYPDVDVVVQGYDTLLPLTQLVTAVAQGSRDFHNIPNLLFKQNNQIHETGFSHKPDQNYNNAIIDWSFYKDARAVATTSKLIMTLPNSGCAFDCSWCGGSRYSYKNIMGVQKTLITRNHQHVVNGLRTMTEAAKTTSIYALQCYSETRDRFEEYLDAVKEMSYQSVSFEMFNLPDEALMRKMSEATRAYILLSPESHDLEISRLAGRGNYSMKDMEAWIPQALDAGVAGVIVWFFIGMPKQTPQSVMETVAYSESLLKKFRGQPVIPLICPMVPFLDPGSRLFEEPESMGYRVFYRTLAEHRKAMVEPLWYRRLNYETQWMSRKALQEVTYQAVSRLVQAKGEMGMMPKSLVKKVLGNIAETTALLDEIEHALSLNENLPQSLRSVIGEYNKRYLSYSSDQIIPAERPFGGRWFDDFTVPVELIAACSK